MTRSTRWLCRPLLALTASLALASGAQAALGPYASFFGVDDGAVPGGSTPNASTAQASFLAAAAAKGPVTTDYLDNQPLGDATSYHVTSGFQVDTVGYTLGMWGPQVGIRAGTYSDQNGPFSTTEGPGDAGKWMGIPLYDTSFTFDAPTYSFGFYATGLNKAEGTGFFLYFDGAVPGDEISLPVNDNGGIAYYGLVFDNPVQTVRFFRQRYYTSIDAFGLDGISFNTAAAAPVPEPAGWALMLAGLMLVGRRRAAGRPVVRQTAAPAVPG